MIADALKLSVYFGEEMTAGPLLSSDALMGRLADRKILAAALLRGIEGFGKSSHIHTTRILSLAEDLPCSIVIVDTDDKIRGFLPQLDELVTEGLVMVDAVEVIRYVSRDVDGTEGASS